MRPESVLSGTAIALSTADAESSANEAGLAEIRAQIKRLHIFAEEQMCSEMTDYEGTSSTAYWSDLEHFQ